MRNVEQEDTAGDARKAAEDVTERTPKSCKKNGSRWKICREGACKRGANKGLPRRLENEEIAATESRSQRYREFGWRKCKANKDGMELTLRKLHPKRMPKNFKRWFGLEE